MVEWMDLGSPCPKARSLRITAPNAATAAVLSPKSLKSETLCRVEVHPVVPGPLGKSVERADIRAAGVLMRARSLGLLIVLSGVFVSSALATGHAADARATLTPGCSASSLRLDKIGENDYTSHRGWIFALRNVGSRTCQMKGYPAVHLLDAEGRAMATTLVHFGGPARAVDLAPWRRAFFATVYAVSGPCPRAVVAFGMGITPPRAVSRLVWYAGRFDLCGPGPAVVSVSPVASTRRY